MATSKNYFENRFTFDLLHPKYIGTWLQILFLFVLGLLPAFIRDPMVKRLAKIVMLLAKRQISVARVNLKCCFPQYSEQQIEELLYKNVQSFLMTLLAQGELIFGTEALIRKRVKLHGEAHINAARAKGKPIIFILPHVWPIEYVGLRLNLELPMVAMAKAHRNGLFNWFGVRTRNLFGAKVYKREAGIRALVKELRQDRSFFYLPDEDLGRENSVFVDFFATQKATLPVVGRLASAGNAEILPVQVGYCEQRHQFQVTVLEPMDTTHMASKQAEALALNEVVEQVIQAFPEQYMWFLKILRTRPEGEPSIYPKRVRKPKSR